jgi:hypothetical protein
MGDFLALLPLLSFLPVAMLRRFAWSDILSVINVSTCF